MKISTLASPLSLLLIAAACSDDPPVTDATQKDMTVAEDMSRTEDDSILPKKDMSQRDLSVAKDSSTFDMAQGADMAQNGVCGKAGDVLEPENFAQLEGCQIYAGSIRFMEYRGMDLKPFSQLREVRGSIDFSIAARLKNLDDLSNLERVEGGFTIYVLQNIQNLQGLSSLRFIGGLLRIETNLSLSSLKGLENLSEIGALTLDGGSSLLDAEALRGLKKVNGDVLIQYTTGVRQKKFEEILADTEIKGKLIFNEVL